ncbi:hypothetical protein [uncultured Sphingomonas sp.]|uniref:hypothetical protein n=1 Tax=uncultured Sphingomonas sp. TaxID=158754 RepID=UPI0035CC0BDD
MSDASAFAPTSDRVPRRDRTPLIAAAILLAFVAGLAIMALLSARYHWSGASATGASATPRIVAPVVVRPVMPAPLVATDPATLAGRETLLAAQLSAIEARTASVGADAATASGKASRAEAMLIAFAARRAIDRGLRLGALEAPLRARFGAAQPEALGLIVGASRNPLTLEDLRAALELLSTNLVTGGDGWWSGLRHELGSLIVIHRAGTPSPAPGDRMTLIRQLVDAGKVEAALGEVRRMPGADDAGNWIAAARRYVDVHHALDTIETAAIEGQAVPAALPAAPPPETADTAAVPPAATH